MIYLRFSSYFVGCIVMVVALAKNAPFFTFGGALAAVLAVFFLQTALPGPVAGWSSRSKAMRFPGRPAPEWSVVVRGLACFVALGFEMYLLRLAWGA